MHTEVIKVKTEGVEPVSIQYTFPDTLEEAVDFVGEDVVFAKFTSQIRIDFQNFVREQIKTKETKDGVELPPKTPEEIQESANTWKPGVKPRGKTKVEKAEALFEQMSPEDRKALLAKIKGGGK